MKNDQHNSKDSIEERPFTFKITKRRTPWTNEVLYFLTKGRSSY